MFMFQGLLKPNVSHYIGKYLVPNLKATKIGPEHCAKLKIIGFGIWIGRSHCNQRTTTMAGTMCLLFILPLIYQT